MRYLGSPITGTVPPVTGELISWDSNGNQTAIAAGTSGHLLKSNGAGQVPVFADAGGMTRDDHDKAVRAMMLEMADIKGAAIGFPEGNADAFDTDTLTATSTNPLYNAAGDYYEASKGLLNTLDNAPATSAYSMTRGVWQHTDATAFNNYIPKLIDDTRTTGWHSATQGTTDSWIVTLSTGGTATMLKFGTSPSYGGAHGSATYTNIVLYASNDGSSWTTLYTVPSGELPNTADTFYEWDFTNTTSYTKYRTDYTWSSSYYHQGPTQWAWYAGGGTTLDGTFVSPAYTATATPTKGYITVQARFVSSSTINTDLTAEISRDGGSTWTAVTLAAGSTQSSYTLYEGGVDISSQPSGTSMKYRVKILNAKVIYISGVVLRWS